MAKKPKTDETITAKWVGRITSVPNAPEDHGRPYFSLPFVHRSRFAINTHHYREPTISIYDDTWDNEHRRWVQIHSPYSIALSTLRNLMALLEEELDK